MKKEPVIVGQILSTLSLITLFIPAVREAVESVGGVEGFGGAIVAVVGFITALVRGRVKPVEPTE